ncbi:hypothetical protein [Kordiimonas marina]|uniref:hypothetical protein n=1 Tax=Kordiimonas marina TaxID=2872312 RepID=UPI001FF4D2BC|nr:hypothetical protein [Kordiimonas marina]MCJ9430226.1 hypothetical protein [Kordiimonas marina]
MAEGNRQKNPKYLAVGIALGVAFGVALHEIAIGIALGVAFGVLWQRYQDGKDGC